MLDMIFAALALATPTESAEIPLSREDTQRVVTSLSNRLKGGFLLTGLTEAAAVCAVDDRCASVESIRRSSTSNVTLRNSMDLPLLLPAASVAGRPVRYVVAIHAARTMDSGLRLFASVYDRNNGRWRSATGDFQRTYTATFSGSRLQERTFTGLRYTAD